ncbi:MAG: protein translocase subunit SecF [Pseudomonadales bacterium]
MSWRHVASAVSLVLVVLSLVGLAVRGLEFGIEFTGGALFDVRFPEAEPLEAVRGALASGGFAEALVQASGSERDVVVRIPAAQQADVGALAGQLEALMAGLQPGAQIVSSAVIGPAIGEELRDSAGLGALASFAAVGIYIMFRFAGKFAIGATVALVHDVILTLGFFVVSGLTFDMPAFAAVLAIIGYSLNDTIVVYDRVRENLRGMRNATPADAINRSLNQTLERTLAMSGTTLVTVVALLLFGGSALRSFSAALVVGVVVGTYSSIYVASSLLLTMGVDRLSLMPPAVEEEQAP